MTVNAAALKKLTIARSQLLINKGHGFWGVLALRLKLVEDTACKTLAVDGKHVFYNPDFVLGLTDSLCRSAMAHEVMHCVFDHINRRGARNPKKWNHAGDYAINLVLEESGFEIGAGWLIDKAYTGLSADEIYARLPDPPDDGSGPEALDEILPGMTDTATTDAVEWEIAAIQAAEVQKKNGKLPGGLERFITEVTTDKVDWRAQLRQFITERAKDDYSWARPNRRFLQSGLYLPTLYSEAMGEIVAVIDTSGSITQRVLDVFSAEIKALCASTRPVRTHVIYCDAEVNHVDVFDPNQEMSFKLHGGGGTDFCPPFAHVEEEDIKPACLIYLTDLYGPFPEAPDYPVLWVSTTKERAPFGTTIHIEV